MKQKDRPIGLRVLSGSSACRGTGRKRRGFLLMELLFVMILFSVIMTVSITLLKPAAFQEHARDIEFMNELKGALLRHRIQSVREPTLGFVINLPGDGRAVFMRQGRTQTVFDDPVYRIYHRKGTFSQIVTRWNFKSLAGNPGSNAYTLRIYKKGRLMAELVYQLGTSTFRENYYEGK